MPRKKIAINTRFLLHHRLEGIGRFTLESCKLLVQQHPEHDFLFLFDRPYHSDFIFSSNVTPVVVLPPARHPLLWYAWFEWAVPRQLKHHQADLFFSPDGYCSLRTPIPTLLVVHDLAFEHFPEQIPFWVRHYYRYFSPRYAHRAEQIAAVSAYTRQDLVQQYGIAPEKISITYNAVNIHYAPLSEAQKQSVRQQYTHGHDYFLFVGAIHPRKNLANILRAFTLFKQQQPDNTVKMLVAGRKAWQSSEAFEVYEQMPHKADVIFTGHLEVDTLSQIVGAAKALVYASLFEGFGIPIIEAMQTHTPVITANVSSMPEVAGGAALLVDPYNPQTIAQAMQTVYTQPQKIQELVQKGAQQCQKFNWQNTADQLWQIMEKMLAH